MVFHSTHFYPFTVKLTRYVKIKIERNRILSRGSPKEMGALPCRPQDTDDLPPLPEHPLPQSCAVISMPRRHASIGIRIEKVNPTHRRYTYEIYNS